VALAREGAFEMGDEARPLRPQVFIVQHARLPRISSPELNAS
jgi:hypothetical protein